jgi:hypothetical protein
MGQNSIDPWIAAKNYFQQLGVVLIRENPAMTSAMAGVHERIGAF